MHVMAPRDFILKCMLYVYAAVDKIEVLDPGCWILDKKIRG